MMTGLKARVLLATSFFSALALTLLASACGSNAASPTAPPGAEAGSPPEASPGPDASDAGADAFVPRQPPFIARDAGDDALGALRQSCAFEAGAWPAQTIGNEYPLGADIPINHVIVIMQENRSYDHYFGRLVAQGYYQAGNFTEPTDAGVADTGAADAAGDASDDAALDAAPDAATSTDAASAPDTGPPGSGFLSSTAVDVEPPGWQMPDGDGGFILPHPDDQYCYGVGHGWDDQHGYWNNGKNDHFAIGNNIASDNPDSNDPLGARTMFYQDDTVIPFYYALASTFGTGDRYFCGAMTSTWPNRLFLMAATSFGIGDNSPVTEDTAATPAPQIFNEIVAAGHTWKDYTDGPHMEEFFPNFGFDPATIKQHYGTADCTLMNDIKNGTLPDVAFMMGDEVTETSDEGPSNLPGIGGSVVEAIIRALWASPQWKDTAVFITYDENGGTADHVPPPPACIPDGYTPHDGSNHPLSGAFDRTGFRVPFIVVSPYAKAHYVSHVVHDHTSITRFIEARFGLPALTARDANSMPPMEMFDFKNPPFMTPPNVTATTTVPQAILTQCGQKLAPTSCQ
jgi:phospholipase C